MFTNFQNIDELKAWCVEQERQTNRFTELLPELSTEDGLVPIHALIVGDDGSLTLRVDSSIEIHPHGRARGPAKLLLNSPDLWKYSAIRVQSGRPTVSKAPVYGVPFRKALDIVLREGVHISTFQIPKKNIDAYYSTLVVRLSRQQGQTGAELQLDAWQWIGKDVYVDYVHAILTDDATQVVHLDGALMSFSCESDIESFLWNNKKHKCAHKEKYFRVDAALPLDEAVLLIRAFFSVEEMADEYFEYKSE
jgi:hypothetical protein